MVDIAESFGEEHANGVLQTITTELLDEVMERINILIAQNFDTEDQTNTDVMAATSSIALRAFIAGVTWAGEEDDTPDDDRIYITNKAAQGLLNELLER